MSSWNRQHGTSQEVSRVEESAEPAPERASKKSKNRKSKRTEVGHEDRGRLLGESESAQLLINLSRASLNFSDKASARQDQANEDANSTTEALRQDAAEEIDASDTTRTKRKHQDGDRSKRKRHKYKADASHYPANISSPPEPQGNGHAPEVITGDLDEAPDNTEFFQEFEDGLAQFNHQPPYHRSDNTTHHQSVTPVTTAVNKSPAGDAQKAKESKRRKRKRTHSQQSAFPSEQDIQAHHEVPIDPELQTLDAATSSQILPDATVESSSFRSPKSSRRGRKDKAKSRQNESHGDEINMLQADAAGQNDQVYGEIGESDRSEDQPLLGLEDEMHRISKDLGTPYTEDTDVEELRRQHRRSMSRNSTGRRKSSSSKTGFTKADIAALDSLRDSYCQSSNITVQQFNDLIQSNIRGNHRAINLFNDIQELFPTRTRSYVQRFCRRRYHNFHARGVWTIEEDEGLKRAVAEKGTSWKVIGEMLDRFAEDCRDRYRNYLHPSAQHRNRDAWTEIEVVHLSQSILDCMEKMRAERYRQKQEQLGFSIPMSDVDSDQEAEDLKYVNWQNVSERMDQYGSSRSRLQCSFKWSKIKEEDRKRYLREVKHAQKNLRALEADRFTANNMKTSSGWRLKRASKKVLNMKAGDRYDLLRAILDAGSSTEENIPWRFVGDDSLRQKWSTTERRAAWLMMKEEIPDSEQMDYRDLVNMLLTKALSEGIDERWHPEVHGWVRGSLEKASRSEKKGSKQSRSRGKNVSSQRESEFEATSQNQLPAPMAPIMDSSRVQGVDESLSDDSSHLFVGASANETGPGLERSPSSDDLFGDRDSPSFTPKRAPHSGRSNNGPVLDPELASAVMSLQQYPGKSESR